MSKTAKQWLEEARANGVGWADEAIENIALQPNYRERKGRYRRLYSVILNEFSWLKTCAATQGLEYWAEIHQGILDSEKINKKNALSPRLHKLPITIRAALDKIQLQQLTEGGRSKRQTVAALCLAMINKGLEISKGEKPSPALLQAEIKKSRGVTVSVSILSDLATQTKLKEISQNGRQLSETAMGLIIVALK